MLQGNYLRKKRTNMSIGPMGLALLGKLAKDKGISMSDVMELLIREEHDKVFGREGRPSIPDVLKGV